MPRPRGPASVLCAVLAAAAAPAQATTFDLAARRAGHWAWQPLGATAPPAAAAPCDHPVDAFVQARLQAAGLWPAPPAPPHVQIRRLWFDATGLPPPPDAVRRFVADPSDAAWEREVAALLASPQHAEHWARHWLDLVRYAESLGHEKDLTLPNAWRYRDYVIRAIAADVPFDQFVLEMVAGDLLEPPRRGPQGENESVQGTAAFWFGEQTHSPVDAIQHGNDRIDNQIDMLGKSVLGLTIACARCHDHKFDAIRSADYYALAGFLRSSRYVQAPLAPCDPAGAAWQETLAAQRAVARAWLAAAAEPQPPPAAFTPRDTDVLLAEAGDAGAWLRTGDAFGNACWRGPWCPDPAAGRPELRVLPGAFWHSGIAGMARQGVLQTGTAPIARRWLHVLTAGRSARLQVIVDDFQVVCAPIYGGLHREVHRPEAHWQTFDLGAWQGRPAYVEALDQVAQDLGAPAHDGRPYPADAWIAVGAVLASEHAEPPVLAAAPAMIPAAVAAADAPLRGALAALLAAQQRLPASPTLPSLRDGTGTDAHLLLRGSYKTPGPRAPRRLLEALAGTDAMPIRSGSGRLELARALLAADNPLPARVAANRLWHHLFGRGLVKTVDNFGALGEPPSHPDLLDWLAQQLTSHGWSQRHVLRLLLCSRTYRQDSRATDAGERLDPDNVLLHRQNVRRLDAESVRDALLAVSGRLDPTLFGDSVPIPLDSVPHARGKPGASGPVDGNGRRSIYLALRRNFLPPLLCAFDLPTPFATVGARSVSNVPAQALALQNDAFVREMCRHWARRVQQAAGGDAEGAVREAYLLAFARPPRDDERDRCRTFLADAAATLGTQPDDQRPLAELLHTLATTKEFTFRR